MPDATEPDLIPVALATRHDGWTAARRAQFLLILARTESVTSACAAVGKSRASAYQLRRHPRGAAFAAAWEDTLQQARDARITAAATDVAQRLADRIARHARPCGPVRER